MSTSSVPHPAASAEERLLTDCRIERLRRSGPGGQRRNKVETGVRLRHLPSGLVSEATERRSAEENLRQAIQRLRYLLAIEQRAPPLPEPSPLWKSRSRAGRISVNPEHVDAPALLAEALDLLAEKDWQIPVTAEWLGVSSTQLVRLIAIDERAFRRLNEERHNRGIGPLKPP